MEDPHNSKVGTKDNPRPRTQYTRYNRLRTGDTNRTTKTPWPTWHSFGPDSKTKLAHWQDTAKDVEDKEEEDQYRPTISTCKSNKPIRQPWSM